MGVRVDYQNKLIVDGLDTIYITGGGYINRPFKGISRESAWGWDEPAWSGELGRSKDLVMTNIDDVDFGLVARCEISYKYMNVQDYMALRVISKQRHCIVNFFNRDIGERVTQEMAFTESSIKTLFAYGTNYLGTFDVSIKLVATNRDRAGLIPSQLTILYDNNGGIGTIASSVVNYSDNHRLADGTAFTKAGYALSSFNTEPDGTGWAYLPSQNITVFNNLTLYAQWVEA